MYQWLKEELESIKTPHFHQVEGPASPDFRNAVLESPIPVPPSYKQFVLEFGNTKLYRSGSTYGIQVYAAPRKVQLPHGEPLLNFGRTDLGLVYFKESLLVPGQESPVFTWKGPECGWSTPAKGFEEWISKKCRSERKRFKKIQWQGILDGPAPFTPHEQAIVEARKRFTWRVIGIASNGDLQFEVHNGSSMILPFLSIGIRGKVRPPSNSPLNGGIWLPVSSVLPGQTQVIQQDCYKEFVDPSDIQAFDEPDPEPALRDRYWEFNQPK
jgi:hypothetical protein